MKIKKNDEVIVIAGKDRGKKGKVMRVFSAQQALLVEKINYQTVYLRKSQDNPKGAISKIEAKIHLSNVKLICPRSGKPTRVGYSRLADGTKQRLAKKSGELF